MSNKYPNRISAEVIADSINEFGFRMLTYRCVLPRIVLAELNTHRMLTRNLASSRAIKFSRMVEGIQNKPFVPIDWMKEHTGMQGTEFFDVNQADRLERTWLTGRDSAIDFATMLTQAGLTKQLCNRILEPFQYVTAIVSGTEWENFFALRAHPAAEIHIMDLAYKMLKAANESEPRSLLPGEWHLPMGDDIDEGKCSEIALEFYDQLLLADDYRWAYEIYPEMQRNIAAGRLARTSYTTLEEVPRKSFSEDIKLALRLQTAKPGHWSPMEHLGQSMTQHELEMHAHTEPYSETRYLELESAGEFDRGIADVVKIPLPDQHFGTPGKIVTYGWSGNLRGFKPYRKMFPGENSRDDRMLKKTYVHPGSSLSTDAVE